MRQLVKEAQEAARKLGLSDHDYIIWWDSSKLEPAPFGPFCGMNGNDVIMTRAMSVADNKNGDSVLVEKESAAILNRNKANLS